MKFSTRQSVNSTFNVVSSLLLMALFLALAYNNYRREQDLIIKGAVDTARTISRQIIETRDYLSRNVTNEPETNSALIPQVAASRVAELITRGSGYYVRQVSLRYRNPDNRPDSYESTYLKAFGTGTTHETWQVTTQSGKKSLRFLTPMVADQSCLTCHGRYEAAPRYIQARFPKGHFSYNYEVGEVIGAVSVAVPMEGLYHQVFHNLKRDLLYDGLILAIFIMFTARILNRTIIQPVKNVAGSISEVARTGNFSERIAHDRLDEIGDLINSFNSLMSELDQKTRQRIESEERYRNFIEIAQSPIITFMADGKIIISNQKAETLFGLSKKELLGQCIFDFLVESEQLQNATKDYFTGTSSALIGTTTFQKVRDVCGRTTDVEMVISVSQSEQSQMFSAILRTISV
jgi:PAS domain S-box-containing protein